MDDLPDDREERDRRFLKRLHDSPPLPFDVLAAETGRAPDAGRSRGVVGRLSQAIGVAEPGAPPRAQRLEERGAILGYRAVIDPRVLDPGQVAFVQVALRDLSDQTLDAFAEAMRALPQVEACHMIAGDFHYMLTIRTETVPAFRKLLTSRIAQLPAVVRTSAILAMQTVKGP